MSNIILSEKFSREELEGLEKTLLSFPQIVAPLVHRFAPGVYIREITMPAGSLIIGHEHKTEHFNIVLKGRADVMMDGQIVDTIVAPCTFVSSAGVRKLLHIHEEMIWQTVHPTAETDICKLEEELVIKSKTFQENLLELEKTKLEDKK